MQWWNRLSVSKKLYSVVGVMAFLIASELFTLLFAMQTLSAVRTLVGGEGLWSKAQKDGVQSLQKYATTKNPKYIEQFHERIKVNLGFNQARIEIEKPDMDYAKVYQGLRAGGIHHEDVLNSVRLMRWFKQMDYVKKTGRVWKQGDELVGQLILLSKRLEQRISTNPHMTSVELEGWLDQISDINQKLTVIEHLFSATLGEASRWLENLLMSVLLLVVFTVEVTGLCLTISIGRGLTRSLNELNQAARSVGRGDFNVRVPVRSEDELGQLARSLNKMTENLSRQTHAREEAQQASHAKNLFLANMSHEIRTPLNAILGFSELLRDPGTPEETRLQYLDVIKRTGNNLAAIINDILDITKIEAEQIEVEKTQISLGSLLEDLQLVLRLRSEGKKIQLSFEPQGEIQDQIISDPIRLRQILINIVGNAIKFTEHGHVRVLYYVKNGKLEFRVEDTGIGIPQEHLSLLFHPFSQGDNSIQKRHGGTGLGLVLSQKLAQLLGGDVQLLRSEPDVGSTFLIQIAYEPTQEKTSLNPKVMAQDKKIFSSGTLSLQGKKILVVEDTLDSQILLQLYLTKAGASVTLANNGQEGVEKATGQNFDLILMDMQMPVMDGFTSSRTLRQEGIKTPIIALTAYSMAGDREKTLLAGCTDYLSKPIDKGRLFNIIGNHLK